MLSCEPRHQEFKSMHCHHGVNNSLLSSYHLAYSGENFGANGFDSSFSLTVFTVGAWSTVWAGAPLCITQQWRRVHTDEIASKGFRIQQGLFLVRSLYIPESILLPITYWKKTDETVVTQYNLQVPFLVDPNTSVQLGDYQKILAYLFKTYSSAASA